MGINFEGSFGQREYQAERRGRGASIFINTAVLKIDRPNFIRPA